MTTPEYSALSQRFELGFTYSRSLGPVISRFFTELNQRKVVGTKGRDGTVYIPPVEFDPKSGEALSEFVEVKTSGTVKSWCWIEHPRHSAPLQKPFAWALIQLDGADTSMLHAVDAGSESNMKTGMAVKIRWAEQTQGHITDIACFDPA